MLQGIWVLMLGVVTGACLLLRRALESRCLVRALIEERQDPAAVGGSGRMCSMALKARGDVIGRTPESCKLAASSFSPSSGL